MKWRRPEESRLRNDDEGGVEHASAAIRRRVGTTAAGLDTGESKHERRSDDPSHVENHARRSPTRGALRRHLSSSTRSTSSSSSGTRGLHHRKLRPSRASSSSDRATSSGDDLMASSGSSLNSSGSPATWLRARDAVVVVSTEERRHGRRARQG